MGTVKGTRVCQFPLFISTCFVVSLAGRRRWFLIVLGKIASDGSYVMVDNRIGLWNLRNRNMADGVFNLLRKFFPSLFFNEGNIEP